jgi:uncharacterized protein involved in type VI secretion and phage assembly
MPCNTTNKTIEYSWEMRSSYSYTLPRWPRPTTASSHKPKAHLGLFYGCHSSLPLRVLSKLLGRATLAVWPRPQRCRNRDYSNTTRPVPARALYRPTVATTQPAKAALPWQVTQHMCATVVAAPTWASCCPTMLLHTADLGPYGGHHPAALGHMAVSCHWHRNKL